MITKQEWIDILKGLGSDMKKRGTIYGWKSPVNETNTMKRSTCVGYVALALQRAKLLPEGKYVHLNNGKLAGTGLSYIKAHPEMYTIITAKATPQVLGERLHVGDICLYSVPHIQVYAGKNSAGSPLWYSLERSSGGIGKPAKLTLGAVFGYYTKRKIEYIIRLKFADTGTKPTTPTNASANDSKPATVKYRLKMGMNIRKAANAKATKIGYAPQGAVLTEKDRSGNWIKTTYCGLTGWVNVSTKYATKV